MLEWSHAASVFYIGRHGLLSPAESADRPSFGRLSINTASRRQE